MKEKSRRIYKSEIIWIVIAGLFAVAALFFGIVGLIERFLPSGNWIESLTSSYNNTFDTSWPLTVHATIYLIIATVIYLISTLIYAKRSETKFEKRERRKARRAMEESIALENAETVEIEEEPQAINPLTGE